MDKAYYARAEDEGTRKRGRAATRTAAGSAARPRAAGEPLTREDWIRTARKALIRGGIGAVRIVPLARSLGVTRGGFYWHFKGRQDLLDALVRDWEQANTAPFEALLRPPGENGRAQYEALVDLWVSEKHYLPAWDAAMRNWARLSRPVANAVRRVDERRIEIIRQIFLDLGYHDPEALVRARISYFHQVGYYTLDLGESLTRRRELVPVYSDCLIGTPPR